MRNPHDLSYICNDTTSVWLKTRKSIVQIFNVICIFNYGLHQLVLLRRQFLNLSGSFSVGENPLSVRFEFERVVRPSNFIEFQLH